MERGLPTDPGFDPDVDLDVEVDADVDVVERGLPRCV
jgi:hypothetical protein